MEKYKDCTFLTHLNLTARPHDLADILPSAHRKFDNGAQGEQAALRRYEGQFGLSHVSSVKQKNCSVTRAGALSIGSTEHWHCSRRLISLQIHSHSKTIERWKQKERDKAGWEGKNWDWNALHAEQSLWASTQRRECVRRLGIGQRTGWEQRTQWR
jgi:hypothetical protein